MTTESGEHLAPPDEVSEKLLKEVWNTSGLCRNTWMSPFRSIVEGDTPSTPLRPGDMPPPPGFEFAEHAFLGDQITLLDDKGVKFRADTLPIKVLGSGNDIQPLTYGKISALAGDFYGTSNPISDGKGDMGCHDNFMDALHTLTDNPQDQPGDARALINYLQEEVNAVRTAVKNGSDPSTVYKGGEVVNNAILQLITLTRKKSNFLSYGRLALINWDHFGDDARTAYKTGHAAAINHAANGNLAKEALFEAYSINAFADHFLQDLFSAGHLRTPRRLLHGRITLADKCAQYMHDEDCALGLSVKDENNRSWTAYGDRRLLDKVNHENLLNCQGAVQTSANEIAWKNQAVLPIEKFGAWSTVPTKASALDTDQLLAPLFLLGPKGTYDDLERRVDLNDRTNWKHDPKWWVSTTAYALSQSKRWDYPMKM